MITHSIHAHHSVHIPTKIEEHRTRIFERTLNKLNTAVFYEGGNFKIKGTSKTGVLIYICQKINEVEWDGLKVKLLELWFPDTQTTDLFHPSDLKAD